MRRASGTLLNFDVVSGSVPLLIEREAYAFGPSSYVSEDQLDRPPIRIQRDMSTDHVVVLPEPFGEPVSVEEPHGSIELDPRTKNPRDRQNHYDKPGDKPGCGGFRFLTNREIGGSIRSYRGVQGPGSSTQGKDESPWLVPRGDFVSQADTNRGFPASRPTHEVRLGGRGGRPGRGVGQVPGAVATSIERARRNQVRLGVKVEGKRLVNFH